MMSKQEFYREKQRDDILEDQRPRSVYQQGHTCSVCGRHLDSYESFSIELHRGRADRYVCVDCDPDMKEEDG